MNLGGDGDAKTPGSDENAKGVPEFWLQIFRFVERLTSVLNIIIARPPLWFEDWLTLTSVLFIKIAWWASYRLSAIVYPLSADKWTR